MLHVKRYYTIQNISHIRRDSREPSTVCMSITVGPQAMKPGEWEEGERKISKGLGGKAAPGRDKMRVIAVESP